MTTELTLREKAIELVELYGSEWGRIDGAYIVNAISDLLDATGAPAYCRVAADLRGEWVEGERGE